MQDAELRTRRLARSFRHRPTKTEAVIWRWLRGRRFAAIKFRRQQPIGRYVLDFYCDDLKLAVELDGLGHGGAQDRRRTAWLNRHGIAVIRFRNQQVLDDPDTVALSLRAKIEFIARLQREPLTRRSAPPSPAGRGC